MNLATLGEAAGLIVALVAVATLYVQLRDRVRRRVEQEQTERQALIDDAIERGKKSRDGEFAQLRASHEAQTALLRSQRDDARRDRDEAQRRADEYERRYMDLRDRRNT